MGGMGVIVKLFQQLSRKIAGDGLGNLNLEAVFRTCLQGSCILKDIGRFHTEHIQVCIICHISHLSGFLKPGIPDDTGSGAHTVYMDSSLLIMEC